MARRGDSFRMKPVEMEHHHSDASAIPANLMRTMPYTSLVAVGSYAAIFASPGAAWIFAALVASEVLNASVKKLLKVAVGPTSRVLRRPLGAMDSGIYPQHFPRPSTTSGMPSGHSQASTLLAVALSAAVLDQRRDAGLVDADMSSGGGLWEWPSERAVAAQLAYVWLIAGLVMLSRTRLAGPLGVKVDGRRVAHHTILQVVVGGVVGLLLGLAAVDWFYGRPAARWALWLLGAAAVLLVVLAAALCERQVCGSSSESDSDTKPGSDSERTSNSAWSEMSPEDGWTPSKASSARAPPGTVGQARCLD